MSFCENCGTEIKRQSAKYCYKCGSILEFALDASSPTINTTPAHLQNEAMTKSEIVKPPLASAPPICKNCGFQVKSDAIFCTKCGTKLGAESITYEREKDSSKTKWACPMCGTVVEDNVVICPKCGVQLLERSPEQSANRRLSSSIV